MFSHQHLYVTVFSTNFVRVGVGSKGMAAMRAVATYLSMARSRILWAMPYVDWLCFGSFSYSERAFAGCSGFSLASSWKRNPESTQKWVLTSFVGQQITFTFFFPFLVSKVNYSRESGEDVTSPKHGKVRYLLCKTRTTTRTRFSQ